jgi:hypothetical protein
MYLTAQRVVASDTKVGINVFLHIHADGKQPDMKNIAMITRVAEIDTGTLVIKNCELPPGGNRVKSYLDIVSDDNITQDIFRAAIASSRTKISSEALPFQDIVGSLGIRFGAEIGLYDIVGQEYDELANAALLLLRTWQTKQK